MSEAKVAKSDKAPIAHDVANAMAVFGNVLTSLPENAPVEDTGAVNSPYVQFMHQQAKNFQAVGLALRKSMSNTDIVLVSPGNEFELISQLNFAAIAFQQFWAQEDGQGQIVKAWFEFSKAPAKCSEYIETVALVYLPDRCEVARIRFRTTKCPAAKTACSALAEVQTPEWLKLSSAHALTENVPYPHLRYYATVELSTKVGKSTGLPYVRADAVIHPTTVDHWRKASELLKDPEFGDRFAACMLDYETRLKAVEQAASKG